MTKKELSKDTKKTGVSRRNFLTAAAAVTAGAATLGFPSVLKAQGPISMRWQSTWPTKDIFHEYALDFAKKVNDMTGGDLKIEVLPGGRRGAGLRPAGCGLQGDARRRPRRLRLPLRQEQRAVAVGIEPRLRDGRRHAALLAQVRRRQRTVPEGLRCHRRQRQILCLRPDVDPAPGLVQEADHQGRRFQGA